ncbi:sulfur oxidation c-type cytochrome SoxX [Rhodoferax sp. GW822-FHT02A01]|uniref:sulfur oxidation c-type cytochrome SoxX n=1 Tax=Rhodoferax sp. GW822-FHT02A01 TaxID=3141537 RepID=UPI00315CE317
MNALKTMVIVAAAAIAAGCASMSPGPDYRAFLQQMMGSSFRDEGIAKIDRLKQDEANAACSEAQSGTPPEAVTSAIQEQALKSVRMPKDGKFLGDWREGEKLAQNGRGMTWTDKSAEPRDNGGNCLNCHQVTKEEIAYGTIGPSLYHYGKDRGVVDPQSEMSRPIVEYTWTKIYNSRSYNACSGMPRFGHLGLLDETQMKHLMALLLDPQSPVNSN